MADPIQAGVVIRKVLRIYVDEAPVLMPAAAVVFVITGIGTELMLATRSNGLVLLALILDLVATTLFTGMVVELVADEQAGRRGANVLRLLRAVTPVLGELILVGVVTGLLEVLGFALIVIPGLVLLTIWSVVAPVVVLERPGGLRALARSHALVRGSGWQVFAVLVVLVIGVYSAGAVLGSIAAAGGTGVGLAVSAAIGVLAAPLSALACSVLYFELRRRERTR